MIHACNKFSWY